ncbi:hypothetical protein TBLA_0C03860 [Henningerozyma blattae CBS 6284]|uniref:DASH complex subunit DAM1 n=1 Tax=Henningerozyma blattae (strain ATCC 34711 / CBS 6284 / DSM 70876 / NBRC 10599 / NRRL Y-10934 / UCD 77-7) TaxID=1071380 RepID=I2H1D5_HENB6|nr:hypothetical protein TBLA_0C03860 [Tetrapisispora blattae CBS 6284]CCH60187.1 hypothetical protein TBLA_0C03860 [Tetrapisispora blattae CBS 6284]
MSQDLSSRPATEYKLSVTSKPGSRRSSFVSNKDGITLESNTNRTHNLGSNTDVVLQNNVVPQIRILNESMITLDSNFQRLNSINESLVSFNESFGSLLYGLMCNAWCVEYPENHFTTNHIKDELMKMKTLSNLKENKNNLKRQLETLQNSAQLKSNKPVLPINNVPSSKKQFIRPALPNRNVYNSAQLTKSNLKYLNRKNSNFISTSDVDDDISSEASFVMNPSGRDPSNRIQKPLNPNAKSDLKYRRKSVLHRVRDSLANDGTTYNNTLSGKASRVTNQPNTKSHTTTSNRQTRINNLSKSRTAWTRPKSNSSLDSRPPFR